MTNSGLNYLLQFSKIQKNEKVGDLEAIDFKTIKDGTQMGHLIITCKCGKYKKQFNIAASILNWKISKFIKGTSKSLDYETVFKLDQERDQQRNL